MSNSDVLLNVLAGDQTSEVIVVDSSFRVLARGIQGVQLRVPPGIYRAKVRVGDQQREKLFSVEPIEPNNHKIVQLDPLDFASPIPLEYTSTSHEYHQGAILNATAAGAVKAQLGHGAEFVVFLRDPSTVYVNLSPETLDTYRKNFEGFRISNLDGGDAHALEEIGQLHVGQGYLIANAVVNPGTYALSRVSTGNERQCLALVVPAGWSLQVFVTMAASIDSDLTRNADFDGAAMVLDRPDAGFWVDRPDLRVLEVARQALARGHNVVSDYSLQELLSGKYQNPMMGLLAAHLLLLDKEPDLDLAQKVITNTGNLIGPEYPDLQALSWKLAQMRGSADTSAAQALVNAITGPPMLQLSWRYVMDAYRSLGDKAVLDNKVSALAGQFIASNVWTAWLENAEYVSARPAVPPPAIDGNIIAKHVDANEATYASPVPSPPASLPPADLDVGPRRGARSVSVRNVVLRGAAYVKFKVAAWLGKAGPSATQAPAAPPVPPLSDAELGTLREVLRENAGRVVSHLASSQLRMLVERVDWVHVVKQLKSASLVGEGARSLTPLQRRLLMSLKSAREQFDDEGELTPDAIERWLSTVDVPAVVAADALEVLSHFAASLNTNDLVPAAVPSESARNPVG